MPREVLSGAGKEGAAAALPRGGGSEGLFYPFIFSFPTADRQPGIHRGT